MGKELGDVRDNVLRRGWLKNDKYKSTRTNWSHLCLTWHRLLSRKKTELKQILFWKTNVKFLGYDAVDEMVHYVRASTHRDYSKLKDKIPWPGSEKVLGEPGEIDQMEVDCRQLDRTWLNPEKILAVVARKKAVPTSVWLSVQELGKPFETASKLRVLRDTREGYSYLPQRRKNLYPEELLPGFEWEDMCVEIDINLRKIALSFILEVLLHFILKGRV